MEARKQDITYIYVYILSASFAEEIILSLCPYYYNSRLAVGSDFSPDFSTRSRPNAGSSFSSYIKDRSDSLRTRILTKRLNRAR